MSEHNPTSRLYRALHTFFNNRGKVFWTIGATWGGLFLASDYIATQGTLEMGALTILQGGFGLSTYLLFAGRHVVTKSDIKAIDYITLFGFATSLASIVDIDRNTYQARATAASQQAAAMVPDLQSDIDRILQSCPQSDHSVDPGKVSSDYYLNLLPGLLHITPKITPQALLCDLWSGFRFTKIEKMSFNEIDRLSTYSNELRQQIPSDGAVQAALRGMTDYDTLRFENELHRGQPFAFFTKEHAYLLAAFTFGIRLTKTTVEINEWHDVPREQSPTPINNPQQDRPEAPSQPRRRGRSKRNDKGLKVQ